MNARKSRNQSWKSFSSLALPLIGIFAIVLTGCGERKEARPGAEARIDEPRVAVESMPTPETKRRPTFAPESKQEVAPAREELQTTTATEAKPSTAPDAAATQTPPAAPIQHALSALEEIPIAIVDRVTTEQVQKVQGAINDLELKYKAENLLVSDAVEAAFMEKLEQFTKLAEEMLQAKTPEEMREKYRQLSEGLKLMDAEIMEHYRAWQQRQGNP